MAAPEEAMAVVNNPAAMLQVAGQSQLGLALFRPRSNYFSSESDRNGRFGSFTIGPNHLYAEEKTLLAPFFARSWRLTDKSAWALAVHTRSGINTEYRGGTARFDPDGDGPQEVQTFAGTLGDGDVKWKLAQALLDIGYSRQLGQGASWGISAVLVAQTFSASGFANLAGLTEAYALSGGSALPQRLSANGSDTSYGAGLKAGVHVQWNEAWSFAASAQSKIYMSRFSDYADFLPDGGRFDLPADIKLGLSWRPFDRLLLNFDIEHIFYGGVDVFGNSLDDLLRCPAAGQGGEDPSFCLGGKHGGGLGWDDVTVFKLGAQWQIGKRWALQAGYSLGHQPVPISDMNNNLFTPYLADAHYTMGISWRIAERGELNLALMYTEEESMNERNRFDIGQVLISEADQFELEISYGWSF